MLSFGRLARLTSWDIDEILLLLLLLLPLLLLLLLLHDGA
jgi:hypothetical protein